VSSPPKFFVIPTTVLVSIKVTNTATGAPIDPTSVTLTSITLNGLPVTVAHTAFTRVITGDYLLPIATSTLQPGSYTMLITVVGVDPLDNPASTVVTDAFVLSLTGQ
jgi:hypothetical protein